MKEPKETIERKYKRIKKRNNQKQRKFLMEN